MRYIPNAISQAISVLYTIENKPYFQDPVSLTNAITVAIHGQ